MSLKVWLPLIKDTYNQGTLNTPGYSFNNFTLQTTGKLGNCYKGQGIYHLSTDFLDNQWSLCAWVKSAGWSQYNDIILCKNDSSSDSCQFYFSIINGATLNIGINAGSGTASVSYAFATNTWYHVAATFNGTTYYLYINGELKKTGSAVSTKKENMFNLGINCRSTNTNGTANTGDGGKFLNDIRIYDHCLSPLEVKEIAQGLVLHYKLDELLPISPTSLSSIITDTAYNSSLGKYGYNATSNLAKTSGVFQGKQCVKISTITAGQTAQPYAYFSNLYTSNGTNQPAYKILNFDYYTTCPTTTWLNIYKLGSGTGVATWTTTNSDGTKTGTYNNFSNSISVKPNEWNHIKVVFHGNTDANAEWGYCINGPAHTSNENYYFLYANISLEAETNMKIEDSSGYNHNGTIIGDLTCVSDTKRYLTSIKLNCSDPTTNSNTGLCYIQSHFSLTTPSKMTIAWWAKPESGYGGSTAHAAFCTSNNDTAPSDYNTTAFHHRDSGFDIYPSDGSGGKRLSFTYTQNAWHHYAITYDGTTARTYQDGIEKSSITIGAGKTLASFSQLYIGFSKAGGVWRKTLGSYSDFRIYVTQLLDADIKKLYNTAMKIDNLGGVHSFEFEENQPNLMWRPENARAAGLGINYNEGLGSYTQSNCMVTCDSNGYRIYRPPNLTVADNGNTMWGGLKIVNSTNGNTHVYDETTDNIFGLTKGHTYIIVFTVKGKSGKTASSFGWSNQMGWGGGGLSPSPSNQIYKNIGNNFNGKTECYYEFTISDDIVKTCTTTYSGFTSGNQYLSYKDFMFGFGYESTESLGTDLYISNIRLFDLTNKTSKNIQKSGVIEFTQFIEKEEDIAKIKNDEELYATEFIEI